MPRSSTPTATPWSRVPVLPGWRRWSSRRWRSSTSRRCRRCPRVTTWPMRWAFIRSTSTGRPTTTSTSFDRPWASTLADPRLVAVGEIGLDHFVPGLDRERQARFYAAQLRWPREFDLPVILHVRRSADALLKPNCAASRVRGGIAHAFNGSEQQAQAFIDLGFKLGFGGAVDLRPRAADPPAGAGPAARGHRAGDRRTRHPAALAVPHRGRSARRARARATSRPSCRASPPCWRSCAGMPLEALAEACRGNARAALPRLRA